MAKLTKAQRREIERALAAVERTQRYINYETVKICHVSRLSAQVPASAGTFRSGQIVDTKHYEHREAGQPGWSIDFIEELTPIDKTMGSDLCALLDATRTLRGLLAET